MIRRKSGNEKTYLNSSNSISWFCLFASEGCARRTLNASTLSTRQRWGRKSTEKVGKHLDWPRYTNNLWSFFFWLRNIWCSDLLFLLFLNRVWDAVGSWAVSRSTFWGRLEDNTPPQNHRSFSEHPHSPHSKGNEWSGTTSPGRYPTCNKSGSICKSKLFKTILQNLY